MLILAGETVFILPFVLARIFRPTFLSVFELTNTEIGYCFSIYGIIAFISYVFGGVIADRFKPRKLMAIALWFTGIGGFYLATIPSYPMLKILYGYWGFTTIFLFWAPMIKATRIWGGHKDQGKAYGLLDGGRGLVAALFGVLGVFVFSLFLPEGAVTDANLRKESFIYVLLITSTLVCLIGLLVYFNLKIPDTETSVKEQKTYSFHALKNVIKLPSVWLLMVIILCAYLGYKVTDIFSQFANEVMKYGEVDAAKTGTFLLFIRPIVGVSIGFLADRSKASIYLIGGFALSIIAAAFFASGWLVPGKDLLFLSTIFIAAIGIYAARVLYFAVMQEGAIPLHLTGTAVGVISFIGYTPDIFAGPLIGYLLDGSPGKAGHQHVFWALALFSTVGFIASLVFWKMYKK
ncbi:MFS transporter [Flavobacteriaceae bacterium F08102]|nr:MFS transporter [Flavobacteriaceae bacterium F08102]